MLAQEAGVTLNMFVRKILAREVKISMWKTPNHITQQGSNADV
jgi:hypothetical protein